jgi:hypothetical protein
LVLLRHSFAFRLVWQLLVLVAIALPFRASDESPPLYQFVVVLSHWLKLRFPLPATMLVSRQNGNMYNNTQALPWLYPLRNPKVFVPCHYLHAFQQYHY